VTDPAAAEEVLVRREGRLGRLTLNRPQALGALTTGMCEAMIAALVAWREDDRVLSVLIDHAGERGFSAGGDIRTLAESAQGDAVENHRFFYIEYQLDHLIFTYPKPVVTVMDGVTMGGGVGISWTATHRIATERTTFAMPETGIGLFPDVGGGWFLPRLPGAAGLWIALTGARLKAADAIAFGVASHFVPAAELAAFKRALAEGSDNAALARYAADPGAPLHHPLLEDINRLFDHAAVEDVLSALRAEASEWALAQRATILTKSPTSLKVARRQLALGAEAESFADVMRMEYRIAHRVAIGHDFLEGVRAVIIDKDGAPKWSPDTLEGVTEAMLDAIFAPLPDDQEWSPLPDA